MSRAEPSGVAALIKDYRDYAGGRLWAVLALMLLGALAEGFGILTIVPLVSIALGQGSGMLAQFGWLADRIAPDQRFVAALALFIGAMAARSALLFARDIELAKLQAGYEVSLRLRAAATLASRGWAFASGIGQAAMQSLLLNDVPRAGQAIGHLQHLGIACVMLLVQLTLAAILSVKLTGVAVLIMLAGSLLSVRWTRRGVRSGLALVQSAEESTGSGFRLHVGLKAALAQGTVPQFLAEYRSGLDSTRQELVRFGRDVSAARTLTFLGSAVAAALLLFVGVRVLALPFPVLVTTLVLFARMAGPAQMLQQSAQGLAAYGQSFAAVERRLGKLRPAVQAEQSREPLDWTKLTLEQARYEHRPGLGLRSASLAIELGEWVGIGGASGAGKTTFVDLAAGLLAPQDGAVRADGQPLSGETLGRWRSGVAYVGQEGAVFDDSVRGNLLAEGARANEPALWAALELAGLAERVRAFPGGLDERVGDRGSQLSGGERQRLVIARAMLRSPRLLILDEATAALDADSEAALIGRLRALKPRPAALIVAHRPTTLAHCDRIVAIRDGKVEKSGDPTYLGG
jgi:ATP-binding cassette subfamily C protein